MNKSSKEQTFCIMYLHVTFEQFCILAD